MNPALIIFFKNPKEGKVKTRIAKDIGDKAALEIYRQLLDQTRNLCTGLTCHKYVYYSDFIDKHDDWENTIFEKRIQSGNELGERMANAFQEVLQQHNRVTIIGSDCPYITDELIIKSFELLNKYDIVIGPSQDGGYYLLAMKEQQNFIFENMTWSIPTVFSETMERVKKHHKTFAVLTELEDIDDINSWNRYLRTIK